MDALDGEGTDEEIEAFLQKEARRSGLVLDDPALIEAWEKGEDKLYIPMKLLKGGKVSGETFASAERMGRLYGHIRKTLTSMTGELRRGTIAADPYYRSASEQACRNCDYFDACQFRDGEAGEHIRYLPKLAAEEVWKRLEGGGEA